MDKFSPIIITSKAAESHLNDIKAQHSDIVAGIQAQASRVANFHAENESKRQSENMQNQTNQMENDKQKMDAETKKLEAENKAKELSIKEQALYL